jgi:OOP family OmpA-OmpF porin
MNVQSSQLLRATLRCIGALSLCAAAGLAQADRPRSSAATTAASKPATPIMQVVVAGTVTDESTRQQVLNRMREIYPEAQVIDQIGVAPVAAPPNWANHVQRLLQSDLRQVSRGQLNIQGNVVEVRGEVSSDTVRQGLINQMSSQINNPTFTLRNGLRVSAAGQDQVDAALANRIIEFETGSSNLTRSGKQVLDELVPVLKTLSGRRFEIIGHTDSMGARSANVALSAARADAVRAYLVAQGIAETNLMTSGVGPDRPVAENTTPEGRARNRRIELRVGQ